MQTLHYMQVLHSFYALIYSLLSGNSSALSQPSALISALCFQKPHQSCISLFYCLGVFCEFQTLRRSGEKSCIDFRLMLLEKLYPVLVVIKIKELQDQ